MNKKIQLMIVGAQKAGTTSLFRYLAQHPELDTHPQPEMTFFVNDLEFKKGYDEAWARYCFGRSNSTNGVLIAKHVMVMYSNEAIERLYDHNPDMSLAILLRNPIDRAYSAYWYARRLGRETIKTFEAALDAEPKRLKEEWYKWRNNAYLSCGIYLGAIEALISRFGKDKIHIHTTDDLRKNPRAICSDLYNSIGVEKSFIPDLAKSHNRSAKARSEKLACLFERFLNSSSFIKPTIRALFPDSFSYRLRKTILRLNEVDFDTPLMEKETRAHLVDYFKEHNAALGDLLKRDLSFWDK